MTSGGETWRSMRGAISKALRVEILDEIIAIATRATERLCAKLDVIKAGMYSCTTCVKAIALESAW